MTRILGRLGNLFGILSFQCSEFLPLKTFKNTQNSLHNYRFVCVLQYKALGGNLLIALGKVPEASDLDLVVFSESLEQVWRFPRARGEYLNRKNNKDIVTLRFICFWVWRWSQTSAANWRCWIFPPRWLGYRCRGWQPHIGCLHLTISQHFGSCLDCLCWKDCNKLTDIWWWKLYFWSLLWQTNDKMFTVLVTFLVCHSRGQSEQLAMPSSNFYNSWDLHFFTLWSQQHGSASHRCRSYILFLLMTCWIYKKR